MTIKTIILFVMIMVIMTLSAIIGKRAAEALNISEKKKYACPWYACMIVEITFTLIVLFDLWPQVFGGHNEAEGVMGFVVSIPFVLMFSYFLKKTGEMQKQKN